MTTHRNLLNRIRNIFWGLVMLAYFLLDGCASQKTIRPSHELESPCVETLRNVIDGEIHIYYANSRPCKLTDAYFIGPTWLHFSDGSRIGFWVHGAMVVFESNTEKPAIPAIPAIPAPHWGPRTGDPLPFGDCSWCSQKGEWRCPAGYRLVDTRTGKLPLLSDEWDERLGSVMTCKHG